LRIVIWDADKICDIFFANLSLNLVSIFVMGNLIEVGLAKIYTCSPQFRPIDLKF